MELRVEARLSSNVAHGSHLEPAHISRLRRVQEELYSTPDWKPLQIRVTDTLNPGQRTAALPARLTITGLDGVFARQTGEQNWYALRYGISPAHLSEVDSDADERRDRVLRFTNFQPDGAEQVTTDELEFWPIPVAATSIMYVGEQALHPLADPDADYSTIDGPLVVLHAAAELLASQKAEDAPLMMQRAQSRFNLLKAQHSALDNRSFNMAGGKPQRRGRRGIDYVE